MSIQQPSQVAINIHDLSQDLYDHLPAPEQTHNGTRWKTIDTPGVHLTFFHPREGAS